MSFRNLTFVIFLMFPFFSTFGQSATIKGVVKDEVTNEPLPYANVYLDQTSIGAATDNEGKYLITDISPGIYTLKVRYLGYEKKEFKITLLAGEVLNKDISLNPTQFTGKEVIITAQAQGQKAAINQQLRAPTIVNVISAKSIQDIPDQNAAESVGRLPGVYVQRSGGEGTKVVIRGLSPKYNNITINGVQLSSTDATNRSVDLSMISPFMLDGIEVTKAITPDMDANAIGGSVNFKLRKAKEGLKYDLMLQGGYNSLKNTYNDFQLMGNVSNRFFKNKLGAFLQLDFSRRNRNSNIMGASYELVSPELDKENTPIISSLSLNDVTRIKKLLDGTLVLDYKIPQGGIVFNNFFSIGNYKAETRNQSIGIDLSTHDYSTIDSKDRLGMVVNSLHYNQDLNVFKINVEVASSYTKRQAPNNLSFNFNEVNALKNFDRSIPPREIPYYAKNDYDATVLANISKYDETLTDRNITAKIDIDRDFQIATSLSLNAKIGGKYGNRYRDYDYNAAGGFLNYGSGQGARNAILDAFPWMKETVGSGSLNLPFPLFMDLNYNTGNFLKGEYQPWPGADIDLMHQVIAVLENYGESDAYRPLAMSSIYPDYSGFEYLTAGYGMLDFDFKHILKITTGIRYEEVTRKYTAIQGNSTIGIPSSKYQHTDTTTEVTNSNWLPMIMVKVKPLKWFDVRFAYTNTLSRPSYITIIPQLNIGHETVSRKNYRLKPMLSHNLDLYLSFYGNKLGLFTIGGFTKRIENMIFYNGGRVMLEPENFGLPATEKGKKLYTYNNNPNDVKLWGIEASWQTHFSYLPGFLKGLVLEMNYTYIHSEAKYPRSEVKTEILNGPPWFTQTVTDTFYVARMLDQPDHVANVAFGLDYKKFSFRMSLLYQSNIFRGVNFWKELRKYTDDYWRWDISVKQGLPLDGLLIYFNVRNLTGTFDRTLNASLKYPVSEQFYGTGVDIGVRYNIK